ncbi:hypothetical protein R3W88_003445 [Solanum pinnatisectum]|uniref:Uncharacterized protein n=1 Tax=Solanum pinnatisectum TaxID=50273 RepID=A0AAV9MP18_9SOLN|nr:hypothetical protein R3W88_003445 [Solanum pinnatisectum]
MKGTLKQKFVVINPVLKDIMTKKHKRIKEFLNIETQILAICAEIAGNDTVISPTYIMSLDFKNIIANINPSLVNHLNVQSKRISNETLASLTGEVNSLKQLKQQRLKRVSEVFYLF